MEKFRVTTRIDSIHFMLGDQSVTTSRVIKSVLQNFLGTYASRYSDFEGYWLFGFLIADVDALLASIARPIVLLTKRQPFALAEAVAPGNRYVGAMLPYTPLHYLMLRHGFQALVMTSGNLSEEPIAIDNDDAFERLAGIADFFLVHNRDIYLRSDDSVVRRSAGATRFMRRSRGYVPVPVFLKHKLPPVLACGAELKNTVCITRGNQAFLSQHIGDLENLATYEFFQKTVAHMRRILAVRPEIIACDMHPDYLSTRWAEEQKGLPTIGVQHHHAHIASCMAEHQLEGAVIGVACDELDTLTSGNRDDRLKRRYGDRLDSVCVASGQSAEESGGRLAQHLGTLFAELHDIGSAGRGLSLD